MDRALRTAAALGVVLALAGCEYQWTQPTAVDSPTPAGPSIVINNTNTNTNNNDRSDTDPGTAPTTPGTGTTGAAPLPAYGEAISLQIGASNPGLLAASCEKTHGGGAWAYLDLLVRTLQQRDPRWGYLCKDPACQTVGGDVVTYKATAGESGIYIVDVIGNHCPLAGETTTARWGVLPFETARRWIGVRP